MSGKELIDLIKNPSYIMRKGQNIMGCFERYYDPNYLIYAAFEYNNKLKELEKIENLDNLLMLANFAADVFY